MRIQYCSDLHLEFANMPVPDVAGDVLVLAGDIHLGVNAIPWIEQCSHVFDHVIYILGNHEYYGQKMWKLPDQIRGSLAGYSMDDLKFPDAVTRPKLEKIFEPLKNVYFLDNTSVKIKDVHFHGSTLWSKPHYLLEYMMNDFKKITFKYPTGGYGKFSTQQAENKWNTAKHWLHTNIVPGQKNVIITHHAPSFEMIGDRYKNSSDAATMNTGYATEILQEFDPADISLWISGHTHAVMDKVVSGIHTVSNCRGYVPYQVNPDFNPMAVVDV